MAFMQNSRSMISAAAVALAATITLGSPARADNCDALATQLKG